jgi:hypothetical protein
VGLGRGPFSFATTIEELLKRKSSGSDLKNENTAVGISQAEHVAPPYSHKVGTNFSDKRGSLGQHSSLADSGYGVNMYLLHKCNENISSKYNLIKFRYVGKIYVYGILNSFNNLFTGTR